MESLIGEELTTLVELGPFAMTPTHVVIRKAPTFEEWQAAFEWTQQAESVAPFWVGDLIECGEAAFGEKYAQALDATTYSEKTLRNYAYVARQVAANRRRPQLGWGIHAEVASLEPDQQDAWLDRAMAEGLTRDELRALLREAKATDAGEDVSEMFWVTVGCKDAADQQRLAEQFRQEGRAVKLKG